MVETAIAIHKCRGCGKVLTRKTMVLPKTKDLISLMVLKSGYEVNHVDTFSGEEKCLVEDFGVTLHRCDPERLCVCDFIGWKVTEAENEHTV